MPELSRFLGIVIGMFYREHGVPTFTPCTGNMKSPLKSKQPRSTATFRPGH